MTWIQTASGKKFSFDISASRTYDINDIAHALSYQCRFSGHTKEFYSVAQHSVLCAHLASSGNALAALLHDASEAYLVDIPRPLKPLLPGYKEIEDRIMHEIASVYGFQYPLASEVKAIDVAMLFAERDQLMTDPPDTWDGEVAPAKITIYPWRPEIAKAVFLTIFTALTFDQNTF